MSAPQSHHKLDLVGPPAETDQAREESLELSGGNGAVGVLEHYQAREDLERALLESQKSELQLRKMIDTIPALAWCNLPDGSNEFLNQRWHDYTGLSPQEAHGWGWKVAIHPDDLGKLLDKSWALLASGEPGEIEARLRRHDGEYRWFLFRVEPLRDELGNIVRWYGTNTDIENLKRTEEKLRQDERDAKAWYDSPSYRKVREHRFKGATYRVVLIQGV